MSALTDLFTTMANKIRSKTGTATTYTPAQMASTGIDDVYAAGAASVPTPTSITPSNSNPVALTANTPVNPRVSGYAISGYSQITPSDTNTPAVSGNTIIKIINNGGYLPKSKPINLLSPDVYWQGDIAANSTSTDIVVTANPRYIIIASARSGNNLGYGSLILNDITNTKHYKLDYSGSYTQDSGNSLIRIKSVSATSVRITGREFATRNHVLIYY